MGNALFAWAINSLTDRLCNLVLFSSSAPSSSSTSRLHHSTADCISDDKCLIRLLVAARDPDDRPLELIEDCYLFSQICVFLSLKDKLTCLLVVNRRVFHLFDTSLCCKHDTIHIKAEHSSIYPAWILDNDKDTSALWYQRPTKESLARSESQQAARLLRQRRESEIRYVLFYRQIRSKFRLSASIAHLTIEWGSPCAVIDQSIHQYVDQYSLIQQSMTALAHSDSLQSLGIIQFRDVSQTSDISDDGRWRFVRVGLGSLYISAVVAYNKHRPLKKFVWKDLQSPQYDLLLCITDWSVFELLPQLSSLELDFDAGLNPWVHVAWNDSLFTSFLECLPSSLTQLSLRFPGLDVHSWSTVFHSRRALPNLEEMCSDDDRTTNHTVLVSLALATMDSTQAVRPIRRLATKYNDDDVFRYISAFDQLTALNLTEPLPHNVCQSLPVNALPRLRILFVKFFQTSGAAAMLSRLSGQQIEVFRLDSEADNSSWRELTKMRRLRSLYVKRLLGVVEFGLMGHCWPELTRLQGVLKEQDLIYILCAAASLQHIQITRRMDEGTMGNWLCNLVCYGDKLQSLTCEYYSREWLKELDYLEFKGKDITEAVKYQTQLGEHGHAVHKMSGRVTSYKGHYWIVNRDQLGLVQRVDMWTRKPVERQKGPYTQFSVKVDD